MASSLAVAVQLVCLRNSNSSGDANRCPQGHKLAPWQALNGSCDGCGRLICTGEQVMDCRACNYYLCSACCPAKCLDQGLWSSINWVVENAKMETSNISSELVPGVSCTNITMASAEKDEFVVTRSSDYDDDHEDQEERGHLQEPTVSGQVLVQQQEAITTAGKAALVVQPLEDNRLDLDAEPTGRATLAALAAPAAPSVVLQEDIVDLTEVVAATASPAPEMALSLGDLAGLDMGKVVVSNPMLHVKLLDLSLAAEPVTSNAVPSHNHDLLDLDQSWTQPTNTVAASSENIPRLDRPPVSSCSMTALLPGNVRRQAEALLA